VGALAWIPEDAGMLGQWLVQAAVSFVLLWGIGLPLAVRVTPLARRREVLLVSPFLGFAVVSAVCSDLGAFGVPVDAYAWGLALLGVVGLLTAGLARRRPPIPYWPVAALCVGAYALAMLPLIGLGYLTVTGTTVDGLSYAVRSEYLREAAPVIPVVPPGRPFYGWVASQIALIRLGDVYYLATAGALTGARSYRLLTPTAALFFGLLPAGVYVLARALGLRRRAGALAAALAASHNLLLWPVHDDFLSQSIALGIFPLVIALAVRAADGRRAAPTVALGLLFGALLSVYPTYAVVAGFVVICIAVAAALGTLGDGKRLLAALRAQVAWGLAVAALVVITNPFAVARAMTELTFVAKLLEPGGAMTVGGGNIVVFPPVVEVLGLVPHAFAAYGITHWRPPAAVVWGLAAAAVSCSALGWLGLPAAGRRAAAACVGVATAMALQQRFLVNPPHGYPYGYFKLACLVAVSLLPLLASGVATVLARPRLRYAAAAALAGDIALNVSNSWATMRYVRKHRVVVTRAVQEIEPAVARLPPEDWVLVDVRPGLQQHWIGYLLKGRRMSYRAPLFAYNVATPVPVQPTFRYALVERALDGRRRGEVADEPWYDPRAYEIVWANRTFELRRRRDDVVAEWVPDDGVARWAAGELLRVAFDGADQRTRIGMQVDRTTQLFGSPRAVEVTLLMLEPGTVLEPAGSAPVRLTPGVWRWSLVVPPAPPSQVTLRNDGPGAVLVHRVRSSAEEMGRHGPRRGRVGLAWAGQELDTDALAYDFAVLPPEHDGSVYRFALHVVDPSSARLFGVWSVDVKNAGALRRGRLLLDVAGGTARATLDGSEVPVEMVPGDGRVGRFDVHVVWWKLGRRMPLSDTTTAAVTRDAAGGVVLRHVATPRVIVLPEGKGVDGG